MRMLCSAGVLVGFVAVVEHRYFRAVKWNG